MATIKSYTDIEQSKKLAEILPLESADMFWLVLGNTPRVHVLTEPFSNYSHWESYPCWSLTALLNLCPTINGKQPILTKGKLTRLWYCYYEDEMDTQTYDNPVDAVFEMIQLLHEQKLL